MRLSPDSLSVRHGAWTFEVRGDEIADLRYGGRLLLRAVRPVIRDQDWNTIPVTVLDQHLDRTESSLTVRSHLEFVQDAVDYAGQLQVEVHPGSLEVGFTGTARSAFQRNRIGLVVLHPVEVAGQPVDCLTADGRTVAGRWPVDISPHQPFRSVQGFRWASGDLAVELRLAGDVFETEDQRNWTDASFKTYSTPLEEPFPVAVDVGDLVQQSARLTVTGTTTLVGEPGRPEPLVVTAESPGRVPGLGLSAGPAGSGPVDLPALDSAGWDTLLVELTGPPEGWAEQLSAAESQASRLGAALDVRLVTADPEVVGRTVEHLGLATAARLGVFDPVLHVTTPPLWLALTTAAAAAGYRGTLVAGARSHFTELNRQFHQLPPEAAALTFSITPQMHATEVAHVVDSLQGQRLVGRDSVRLAAGRAVHVGPITLRQRFNAVATSADAPAAPPDPLQRTEFAAAWTLGSLVALTQPGIDSVCYYPVSGPGGVVADDGSLHPVGRLLSQLARLRGRTVLHTESPAGIVAYAVASDSGVDLFVANLTDRPRTVAPYRLAGSADPSTPIVLRPWGVSHRDLPSAALLTDSTTE